MMSFPPHCSNKLQPLDVSVFGPFKTYVNQASDNWMREKENSGKSMTIHIIPKIVAYAFPKAMTPSNIMSRYKATEIAPFDKYVFSPDHFLSAYATDRPLENRNTNKPTKRRIHPNFEWWKHINCINIKCRANQTIWKTVLQKGKYCKRKKRKVTSFYRHSS